MEWISVKDRLPEEYLEVITYSNCGTYLIDYIDYKGFWSNSFPLSPDYWSTLKLEFPNK